MSLSYLALLERHHRHSVRLGGRDYAKAGRYFVTVCSKNKECVFGEITDGKMKLSTLGEIVADEWKKTPQIRPYVVLDAWVVMPNHMHGIFILEDCPGTVGARRRHAPTQRVFAQPIPDSLPTIINQFKGAVTRRIRALPGGYDGDVWQRNYHEHIIRNDAELGQVRVYIRENPRNWERDEENMR